MKWSVLQPRFSKEQWRVLASAFSNMSQAIILFSLAAFFVPEAVSLSKDFSQGIATGFFLSGLTIFLMSVILVKKGR